MAVPTIVIQGANARVSHLENTEAHLDACMAAEDPRAKNNQAFRDGRWDGRVRLYNGKEFPAGLTDTLVAHLKTNGYEDVKVVNVSRIKKPEIDLSRLTDKYIRGLTLRYYQMPAIISMLKADHGGFLTSPTGSGKTLMGFVIAAYLYEEFGWRTLFMVPKKGLLTQTFKKFRKWSDGDIKIGMAGDGVRRKGSIVVATSATMLGYRPRTRRVRKGRGMRRLPADLYLKEMMDTFEVLFLDECHHASADSWFDISMASKAVLRLACSGTPLKHESLPDLRLMAATGSQLHKVETQDLIDTGDVATPLIALVASPHVSGPPLPHTVKYKNDGGRKIAYQSPMSYREAYEAGIVRNKLHNNAVIRAALWFIDRDVHTLIICRRKDHFKFLRRRLERSGVSFSAVWGDTDTAERELAKAALEAGTISCLLASTIFDEGEDVTGIEAIVLAEGVKVSTNSLQRVGRGMRKKKYNFVFVVDFVPVNHPKLEEHATLRGETYESEGYHVTVIDWPSPEDKDFDEENLLPFDVRGVKAAHA